MATHTPLTGATAAAGGELTVTGEDSQVLLRKTLIAADFLKLADVQYTSTRAEKYTELVDVDDPDFVEEGAAKPVGGAEFGSKELTIQKLALIVPFTDELVADARVNPQVIISPEVAKRFARKIDANAIGKYKGANISSPKFNSCLVRDVDQKQEIGTDGDSLRKGVSGAMGQLEAEGFMPDSALLAVDVPSHIRDARRESDNTDPTYASTSDALYGLRYGFSSNLNRLKEPAAAGKVVGAVWDSAYVRVRVREDLGVTSSKDATIKINGVMVSCFESNLTAVRWEMRIGFLLLDERAVCLLVNEVAEAPEA